MSVRFAFQISQADFELVKIVQENSKLLSKIVQSPDKIQVFFFFLCRIISKVMYILHFCMNNATEVLNFMVSSIPSPWIFYVINLYLISPICRSIQLVLRLLSNRHHSIINGLPWNFLWLYASFFGSFQ